MSRLRRAGPLALLLLAFLAAGLLYDLTTPPFEKPDESHHFFFAVRLARGEGLPVQGAAARETPWAQEGSQPPLHYALAGGLLRLAGLHTVPADLWSNPHAAVGVPTIVGNKNIYVPEPGGPFATPRATALHLVRWLSLLMGAVTVGAGWLLGRELAPARPLLRWVMAGLLAFTPQFLFITTSASNDATITALATVALWLLVRATRRGGLPLSEALLLAFACGAAALTKLGGIALLPLAVGTLLLVAWQRVPPDEAARARWVGPLPLAALIVGAVALVSGWWYWRNLILYGDPTGLRAMLEIVGTRPRPLSFGTLRWELEGLRLSYWALFGWFNILADAWVYRLLDGLLLAAGVGLLWIVAQRLLAPLAAGARVPRPGRWLPWLPVLLWPLLVFVSLVRWNAMTHGAQGRLLFPAIAAIAALLASGWLALLPPRWERPATLFAGALWLLWSLSLPLRVIAPTYAPPPHGPTLALPTDATPLDLRYGNRVRLLGYRLTPVAVGPSQPFHLTLFWQPTAPLDSAYSVGVKLFGRNHELLARADSYPGRGLYPTTAWQPGEVVVDEYTIWVSGRADAPVLGELWVDLYTLATFEALPVTTASGDLLGTPQIARLKVAVPPAAPATAPLLRFGDGITLADAEMAAPAVAPGETVTVTLTWQPEATPSTDYTLFLHLVPAGAPGTVLAQRDGTPRDGAYPTSAWAAGEMIPDSHTLTLPPDLPPGDYELLAGLYRLDTLARLPIEGHGDAWPVARLHSDGRAVQIAESQAQGEE